SADWPRIHAGKADRRRDRHGADRRHDLARRRPRRAGRQPRQGRAGRWREPDGGGGLVISLAPLLRGRDERSSLLEGWGGGLPPRVSSIDRPVPPHPDCFAIRPLPASGARLKELSASLAPSLRKTIQRLKALHQFSAQRRQAVAIASHEFDERSLA